MSSPTQPRFREVIDDNGRVYRIGETDRDIMGRSRAWMVWMPWIAMMAISSSEYAFTSAEDTLVRSARLARRGHIFWLLGVWVLFQAAVAFPAGRLRESGKLSARVGDDVRCSRARFWDTCRWHTPRTSSLRTWASGSSAEPRPVSSTPPASTWWVSGIRNARAARPVSSTAASPTGRCPSSSCSPPTWMSATTRDSCSRSASSWPRWWPSAGSSSRTRRRTGGPRTSTR